MTDAARELQVNASVIRRLLADGVLPGRQVVPHAPWVIDRGGLELPEVAAAVQNVRSGRRNPPRRVAGQTEFPFSEER